MTDRYNACPCGKLKRKRNDICKDCRRNQARRKQTPADIEAGKEAMRRDYQAERKRMGEGARNPWTRDRTADGERERAEAARLEALIVAIDGRTAEEDVVDRERCKAWVEKAKAGRS